MYEYRLLRYLEIQMGWYMQHIWSYLCYTQGDLLLTPPVSVPEKLNLIEVDSLLPLSEIVLLLPSTAEIIEVIGGVVSTVHVKEAGVESLFPALSSDITVKVCIPSFNKLGNTNGLVHATYLELSMLHSR